MLGGLSTKETATPASLLASIDVNVKRTSGEDLTTTKRTPMTIRVAAIEVSHWHALDRRLPPPPRRHAGTVANTPRIPCVVMPSSSDYAEVSMNCGNKASSRPDSLGHNLYPLPSIAIGGAWIMHLIERRETQAQGAVSALRGCF